MRAVLDSNVLARAAYSVGGPAEELVRRLAIPPNALVLSAELLTELRRVLRYPRLRAAHKLDYLEIDRSIAIIESVAETVVLRQIVLFASCLTIPMMTTSSLRQLSPKPTFSAREISTSTIGR